MSYLKIDHVDKTFQRGATSTPVLKDISLEIEKGEYVSVIGHSGCGKSTLLNIIAGLTPITSGAVLLEGIGPTRIASRLSNGSLSVRAFPSSPLVTTRCSLPYGDDRAPRGGTWRPRMVGPIRQSSPAGWGPTVGSPRRAPPEARASGPGQAKASTGGQAQARLRSPHALSTRRTGGQYLLRTSACTG